jgi:hypothetical protein
LRQTKDKAALKMAEMTSPWIKLDRELDHWTRSGQIADLWWRDDDAAKPTPALDQLVTLSQNRHIPLGLAVIPQQAEAELGNCIGAAPVTVLQHGYAHLNHAFAGTKKCELGGERPVDLVIGELATGWSVLERLFGEQALPVLIPPWNRIAAPIVPMLPEMHYIGLSTFGPRKKQLALSTLPFTHVNTHVDIVDWKGTRGFIGEDAALKNLVSHLEARRLKQVDPAEATGLLTHHLVHDEACWNFLDALFAHVADHPNVAWRSPRELFDLPSGEGR